MQSLPGEVESKVEYNLISPDENDGVPSMVVSAPMAKVVKQFLCCWLVHHEVEESKIINACFFTTPINGRTSGTIGHHIFQ